MSGSICARSEPIAFSLEDLHEGIHKGANTRDVAQVSVDDQPGLAIRRWRVLWHSDQAPFSLGEPPRKHRFAEPPPGRGQKRQQPIRA